MVGFTNSSGEGGSDIFIAKCNSSGNLLWQRTLGGTGTDRFNDSVCDSSGNFYVVGESNSIPSNNYNIFIKKYDSNGNDVWDKVLKPLSGSPNLYANSIALDQQNNIYIAGYSDFDTTNNILLFKLSSDGAVDWYEVLGETGGRVFGGGVGAGAEVSVVLGSCSCCWNHCCSCFLH